MASTEKIAIVLVVDRLSARALGCYGNTWNQTESIDQLAATSTLFEHGLADSIELETAYQAITRAMPDDDGSVTLFTDEPILEQQFVTEFGANRIADVQIVDLECSHDPAESIELTHCGQFFARLIDWISGNDTSSTLWVHYSGLDKLWDAPYEIRSSLADEDDPDPPRTVQPPNLLADLKTIDPDEMLGFNISYAAQVQVLDTCIGVWKDFLDAHVAHDLFALMAPRGFPLGEHGVIGNHSEILYSEATSVPLMIQYPREDRGSFRSQAIVQPHDIAQSISSRSLGGPEPEKLVAQSVDRQKTAAFVFGDQTSAVRTPAWYLITDREGRDAELYIKPDDRWEINDVASRCSSICEQLIGLLDEARKMHAIRQQLNFDNFPDELFQHEY